MRTTSEVRVEVEAQGPIKKGTQGWWPVWGSSPQDIEPGDYVLVAGGDEFYVQDTYRAKAAPMRVGVVVDGEAQTIGAMCRITILRPGTKSTLSRSVRWASD